MLPVSRKKKLSGWKSFLGPLIKRNLECNGSGKRIRYDEV